VTYGEELLCELGKSIPVNSYLSAEQQEELKQVQSKGSVQEFLAKNGITAVSTHGDLPSVASNVVFNMRFDRASKNMGCEGCLLIPITLQAIWLIDAYRMGKELEAELAPA